MKTRSFRVASAGKVVCGACLYSSSIWFRIRGLLGRESLSDEAGIWLKPCSSIHMFFMKFPIDAVFLDGEKRIVRIYHSIRPWRCTPPVWGAHSCLEIAAGRALACGLKEGDRLEFGGEM